MSEWRASLKGRHKIGKGIVSLLALAGFVWLSVRFVHAKSPAIFNETDAWILLGARILYFAMGTLSVLYFISWLFAESCGRSLLFHHWGKDKRCTRCGKWRRPD